MVHICAVVATAAPTTDDDDIITADGDFRTECVRFYVHL